MIKQNSRNQSLRGKKKTMFTIVPFSITTSKDSSLKGKSSMSASITFISGNRGDKRKKKKEKEKDY